MPKPITTADKLHAVLVERLGAMPFGPDTVVTLHIGDDEASFRLGDAGDFIIGDEHLEIVHADRSVDLIRLSAVTRVEISEDRGED